MKEIVAEITRLARRSPDVNQRSGVSVRASIANYESLLANALRRAIRLRRTDVVPRVSDLPYVIPTISGKVEFETVEDGKEEQIIEKLIQGAVVAVFNRYFNARRLERSSPALQGRLRGRGGDMMPSRKYVKLMKRSRASDARSRSSSAGERPGSCFAPSSSSSRGCT